jgi:hypothetical protein
VIARSLVVVRKRKPAHRWAERQLTDLKPSSEPAPAPTAQPAPQADGNEHGHGHAYGHDKQDE